MQTKSNAVQNFAPGVEALAPWRVQNVVVHSGFRLEVIFVDGVHGFIDLSGKIFSEEAGVFALLRDPVLFNQVFIEYGAVTWPGGLDLAPDAMHDQIEKNGEWVL